MLWLELFRVLHIIGLAFGLGGATIAAVISAKAEKDKDVGKALGKIMPSIVKFIWLGMLLLIISGIALPFYISWSIDKNMLLAKHVLVALIIIIGIALGINAKKMHALAPKPKEKPSAKFLAVKKLLKAFSIINLILWYAVTIMSVFL